MKTATCLRYASPPNRAKLPRACFTGTNRYLLSWKRLCAPASRVGACRASSLHEGSLLGSKLAATMSVSTPMPYTPS